MLIISETRNGQSVQRAALEGKKVIEGIKSNIDDDNFHIIDNMLEIGYMNFTKSNGVYKRYLDESYNDTNESSSKYTETITLNKTEAKIGDRNIDVNSAGGEGDIGSDANVETLDYKIFVKEEGDNIVIYSKEENEDNPNIEDIGIGSAQIKFSDDIKFSVYTYWDKSNMEKKVIIENSSGTELLGRIFKNIVDKEEKKQMKLIVNFDVEDTPKAGLKNIKINVYNKDSEYLNIGLEKSDDLNIDIETCKGKVNVYKDKSENEVKIGDLHDIKVEIGYTGGKNIFTDYYNENIDVD